MTTSIEILKQEFSQEKTRIISMLGTEEKANRFLVSVAHCFRSTPKLNECSKESIMMAFMKVAEYNLFPSTVSGEAFVLPYYNTRTKAYEAQFQLGYKGILTLLYRAGTNGVYSDIVRSNDSISVLGGTDPKIVHEYNLKDRGEPIGSYAVAMLNGEKIWKYMGKNEILAFREFSKTKESAYSPWNPKSDPELNMWKKTVLKQLAKTLPQNEVLAKAMDDDNSDGDIHEFIKRSIVEKSEEKGKNLRTLFGKPTQDGNPKLSAGDGGMEAGEDVSDNGNEA